MQRYLSLWLHWLLVIVIFAGTVDVALLQNSDRQFLLNAPLTITMSHPDCGDGVFTKPSSLGLEYLRQEESRHRQVNPIARLASLVVPVPQQQRWEQHGLLLSAVSFLLSFPRKVAPASPTDDHFFS